MKIFDMDELNEELRNQAIHLGLCDEWQKLWKKEWEREKMVEMMYRGLGFCIKYHYPSNDFILKHFDIDFRMRSKVFVNDRYSVLNPEKSLILGTSDIKVRYNACHSGIIHVRDNASVTISAKNRSFVIVHLHERAAITAEQYDMAKIVIVKHSENTTINADRNIKVREAYDEYRVDK